MNDRDEGAAEAPPTAEPPTLVLSVLSGHRSHRSNPIAWRSRELPPTNRKYSGQAVSRLTS
jgi:hypothetical protein